MADYVNGKTDWFAHGLPREGETENVAYAGELVDEHPPTCHLESSVAEVADLLEQSSYGYCLIVNQQRVVLGRLRRSMIAGADPTASVESAMESGPSTVRPNTPARELAERLRAQELRTAVVTTPGGRLIGVFWRERLEAPDDQAGSSS